MAQRLTVGEAEKLGLAEAQVVALLNFDVAAGDREAVLQPLALGETERRAVAVVVVESVGLRLPLREAEAEREAEAAPVIDGEKVDELKVSGVSLQATALGTYV